MAYEVENKHPAADLDAVRIRLAEMNVEFIGVKEQTDLYYNHPARDFSETDEALRIRRSGDKH
ncbi:MAG: CYTH domain-containing protein, partial [Planctomycetales bacterium]